MGRRPPNKPSRRRASTRARSRASGPPESNGDQQAITFGSVEPIEIKEEMERSYLDYSMSVIVSRALPDVRDGLKPVARRFLYAMNHPDLGARPDRAHLKCARITGDVTGKYHPYGTAAAYDALARLAQDFSLRYPLIDGHGNFGSPDDGPAAERYCVVGETLVALADGSECRIDELVPDAQPNSDNPIEIKVLDRYGDPVVANMLFHSGSHPVYTVRTESGREITGTANHPLLCLVRVGALALHDWRRVDQLRPGDITCVAPTDEWMSVAPTTAIDSSTGGCRYDRVVSVEFAGVQPVYSVRVDSDDHSFLAGGFVNHNTEARLSTLAMEMLAGIDENTVDFVPNYTNELMEPTVLPARFPNLLVNGVDGIAVAMATKIPTHNLTEIIDATVHVIENPNATPKDLMKFVKGPDFPTGAMILGRQGIVDAYTNGRGSIKVRATAEIVEGRRGYEIIVTEIPYQTSVGSIAGRIAELVNAKQLDGIRNVNDASAKGKTRLVIELKRDANANVVLNNLWKHTQLQTTFPVNMVALVDGVPRTLNLAQILGHYVDHQLEVIKRRSQFRLDKAQARAHIVEGLLKALGKIDAIIKLIRGSADREAARKNLMAAPHKFSEIQANYILDMPLARLTRLGTKELKDEMAELQARIKDLQDILRSDRRLRAVVKDELEAVKKKFGDERRTKLAPDVGEMNLEDLIQDEEVVVVRTEAGYIKTVAASKYRTQGRGGRGVQGANLKEADLVKEIVYTTTHAHLLMFSNQGRVFRLRAHEIPMKERTARGTALVNLLPLRKDESIEAIIANKTTGQPGYLFFATKQGQVKKTLIAEYDKSRKEGFIAINLRKKDELVRVVMTSGSDDIIMVTRHGQSIRFDEKNVRPMGRSAAGVRGIRLKPGDEVVSCDVVDPDGSILIVTDEGYGKRTLLSHWRRIGRGNQGIRAIKLNEKKGKVVSAFLVGLDDELFLVSTGGITVRIAVRGISTQGRDATGVRVMNLGKGQRVASASPVFTANGEAEAAE